MPEADHQAAKQISGLQAKNHIQLWPAMLRLISAEAKTSSVANLQLPPNAQKGRHFVSLHIGAI